MIIIKISVNKTTYESKNSVNHIEGNFVVIFIFRDKLIMFLFRHKHDNPDYHACTNDCSSNSGVNLQRVSQSPIGRNNRIRNYDPTFITI